jgi:lipopolysaccharide biosynthesis protein
MAYKSFDENAKELGGIANKENNMTETKETIPQRITLDGVAVRNIEIHDGQFDSHYEDLVSLEDVERLVEQANCLICLSEGKASGLQYALNALLEKTPKSKKG